jgi:hypothetical protein
MAALPQFLHHLRMGDSFFSGCGLGLCHAEFLEEFDLGIQFFVVLDAHDNQVAFTVRGQIDRRILFMAEGSDFPGFVSQA